MQGGAGKKPLGSLGSCKVRLNRVAVLCVGRHHLPFVWLHPGDLELDDQEEEDTEPGSLWAL